MSDDSYLRRPTGPLSREESYAEVRARIFGEDRSSSKGTGSRGRNGRGGGGGGEKKKKTPTKSKQPKPPSPNPNKAKESGRTAVLSLDEVSYDRDVKWYNKASDARPKPKLEKGGRMYRCGVRPCALHDVDVL